MIKTYKVETGMGHISSSYPEIDFLTKEQLKDLNSVGGSGSTTTSTIRTTREEYLNSLNIGEFSVQKTRGDNGDFSEAYTIIFVPNEGSVVINPRPQPLDDQVMDFSGVIAIAEEYVKYVYDGEYMKDHENWFFEAGLEAVYGKGIWDKVNEMT